jgi:hypothetical protein
VEVATLSINGSIVAYVVGICDGRTYRVFDGHFDTEWARYSPGRLIEDAVLQHVISEQKYDTVDWMLGVAAEKILVVSGANEACRLTAVSQVDSRLLVSDAKAIQ